MISRDASFKPARRRRRSRADRRGYLYMDELAKRLSIPMRTIYHWSKIGKLKPDVKNGVLIMQKELVDEIILKLPSFSRKRSHYSKWITAIKNQVALKTRRGAGGVLARWIKAGIKSRKFFEETLPCEILLKKFLKDTTKN